MKLKCIGGGLDGQLRDVDDTMRIHDQVRLSLPNEFKVDTFAEDLAAWREQRVPDHMINKYAMYRVCAIYGTKIGSTEKLELKYLIPHDWHEWEAILHQFGK